MNLKNRKVKPIRKRKQLYPSINIPEICKEVSEATGYRTPDVKEVIYCFFNIVIERLMNKYSVNLAGFGRLIPTLLPGREVSVFGKGKKDLEVVGRRRTDPRWKVNFSLTPELVKDMKEISITEEDLNNLYEE